MPPPRDPGKKKELAQNSTNTNVEEAETQEAVLNLISSSFPPLPQDSNDLDSDMEVDNTPSATSPARQLERVSTLETQSSGSSITTDPASSHSNSKSLKRQKRQEESDCQPKKINVARQLPESALNNRYSSHCQGPFEIIVSPTGVINTSLHPLTVGRLLSTTLKKDILEIKKLGFSKISVQFKSREAANHLINNPILNSNNLMAYIPSFRVSRQGIIRNILLDLSESMIEIMR